GPEAGGRPVRPEREGSSSRGPISVRAGFGADWAGGDAAMPPDPRRPKKNGSSSAIDPSGRGAVDPRVSVSWRPTWRLVIARCRSRRLVTTSSRPSRRCTTQRSGTAVLSARYTLNCSPQLVQRTVVPRSETSASSKSYSVLQRLQVISIVSNEPGGRPRG